MKASRVMIKTRPMLLGVSQSVSKRWQSREDVGTPGKELAVL